MRRLITLIFAYFSYKIKEDRVGRICSMRGIGKKFICIFFYKSQREQTTGTTELN